MLVRRLENLVANVKRKDLPGLPLEEARNFSELSFTSLLVPSPDLVTNLDLLDRPLALFCQHRRAGGEAAELTLLVPADDAGKTETARSFLDQVATVYKTWHGPAELSTANS